MLLKIPYNSEVPSILLVLITLCNHLQAAPPNNLIQNKQPRQDSSVESAAGVGEGTQQTLDGVAVILASIFKGIADIPVSAINAVIRPQQQQQGIPVMIGNSVAAQPIQNTQRFQPNPQLQSSQVQNLQPNQNSQLYQTQPIQVVPVQPQQIQYVNPIVITSPPQEQRPAPTLLPRTAPPTTTGSDDDADATTTDDIDEDADAESEN